MAQTNCIVTDRGTVLDRDEKRVYTYEGYLIADLSGLDISEMSNDDLVAVATDLEFAFRKGYEVAQEKFAKKIREIFGICE